MKSSLLRFTAVLAVVYLGGLLFAFGLAFWGFAEKEVDIIYRSGWIVDEAFLLFCRWFTALTLTAVLANFSLFYGGRRTGTTNFPGFSQTIIRALIIIMILTAVLTLIHEVWEPHLQRNQSSRVVKTTLIETSREAVREARSRGEFQKALFHQKRYNLLKPEDVQGQKALREIEILVEEQEQIGNEASRKRAPAPTGGMSAQEAMERALAAWEDQDFFTANYYAQLGYQIDDSREDAREMITRSRAAIDESRPLPVEEELARLFSEKERGYEALNRGDFLKAYYVFRDLRDEHPHDPDVQEYFGRAEKRLAAEAFFQDELIKLTGNPGRSEVAFVNADDKTGTELVFIDELINGGGHFYARGIEFIRIAFDGTLEHHFTAPWGKIVEGRMLLKCVDRRRNEIISDAVYHTGRPEEALSSFFTLKPRTEQLPALSLKPESLKNISFLELLRIEKVVDEFGRSRYLVQAAILDRLALPFLFVGVSFFFIGLGWSLRLGPKGSLLFGSLMLPLMVLVIHRLFGLLSFTAALICRGLLISLGFTPALILFIVLQVLFLFLIFLYLGSRMQLSGSS